LTTAGCENACDMIADLQVIDAFAELLDIA
jgi:hypothetical protein